MSDRIKRPSYQWYPGDWRRDTAVQSCTFEARALWREMLDLMHDGEPYGHLTAGGVPIDEAQLARIVGVSVAKVRRWLGDLEARRVFSRTEASVIYSRRMVRDEHIRQVRKESGAKGGNPALKDKGRVNGLVNQDDNHSVADAVCSLQSASAEIPTDYCSLPADAAVVLAAAANRGIAERYGERPAPIRHDAPKSQEAAQAIAAAGVPLEFARDAIYSRARSCELQRAPYSLGYFVAGTIEDWQADMARRAAAEMPAPKVIPIGIGTGPPGRPRPSPTTIAQRAFATTLEAIEDL